jgi:molybdopterin synthase sulfur carrier subunit
MVTVYLASVLRAAAPELHGREWAGFSGTVGELLERIGDEAGPAFRARLFEEGKLRRYLNVYVDGTDIRFAEGLSTELPPTARVDLIPAVAGG